MALTKIAPFRAADLRGVGGGLNRPECVLAAPDLTWAVLFEDADRREMDRVAGMPTEHWP